MATYVLPAYLAINCVERYITKGFCDMINGVKFREEKFQSMEKKEVEILKKNLTDIVENYFEDEINYAVESEDPITGTVYKKTWTKKELEKQIIKCEHRLSMDLTELNRLKNSVENWKEKVAMKEEELDDSDKPVISKIKYAILDEKEKVDKLEELKNLYKDMEEDGKEKCIQGKALKIPVEDFQIKIDGHWVRIIPILTHEKTVIGIRYESTPIFHRHIREKLRARNICIESLHKRFDKKTDFAVYNKALCSIVADIVCAVSLITAVAVAVISVIIGGILALTWWFWGPVAVVGAGVCVASSICRCANTRKRKN